MFLCPNHRKVLARQPESTVMDLWFEWVEQAALMQGMDEIKQAVSYVGCAMDLMCDQVCKQDVHSKTAMTKLTLSSIYLSRLFAAIEEPDKSAMALSMAYRHLGKRLGAIPYGDWAKECMSVLVNKRQHEKFFQRYLSFPLPGQQACVQSMVNPQKRVLH